MAVNIGDSVLYHGVRGTVTEKITVPGRYGHVPMAVVRLDAGGEIRVAPADVDPGVALISERYYDQEFPLGHAAHAALARIRMNRNV